MASGFFNVVNGKEIFHQPSQNSPTPLSNSSSVFALFYTSEFCHFCPTGFVATNDLMISFDFDLECSQFVLCVYM